MTATRAVAVHRHDATARLIGPHSLHVAAEGHGPGLPTHVQAGSAVRHWNGGLVVIQDDVQALALTEQPGAQVTLLPLPAGPDGALVFGEHLGNKARKLDLEAALVLPDGRLVALGSGSTDQRQRIVVVAVDHTVRLVDASDLYAMLRGTVAFAGSELNIEGATISGSSVVLFQRGNGATTATAEPVDAIGWIGLDRFVAWLDGGAVPVLDRVLPVALGSVAGVPLSFTDATALPDGRLAFIAVAEDSPDTYRDGAVVGCRFGVLDGDALVCVDVLDEDGAPSGLKLEGIDWCPAQPERGWAFVVVADMDDHTVPATMATLLVEGL